MKTGTYILVVAAVIVTGAAGIAAAYALIPGRPAPGTGAGGARTALLVVDIQEDFTGPARRRTVHNAERMVRTAVDLVNDMAPKGSPVAYIRNIFTDPDTAGMSAADEPGSQMDRRLPRLQSIRTFTKTTGDALSNPDLGRWLHENKVDRVVIVGLDAFYCIDDTIRGALAQGFKVTAVMDGIATQTGRDVSLLAAKWRGMGVEVR